MYVFIYLCMYVPVIIMNLIADVIRYHKAVLQHINVCMYVCMYVPEPHQVPCVPQSSQYKLSSCFSTFQCVVFNKL
jgi:hypothetical protein